MSNTNQPQSFGDYYSQYAKRKVTGRTTFRRHDRTGILRWLSVALYPIALLQVVLSPLVIIGLGTLFDPLTAYFDKITAILAYLLTIVLVWVAVRAVFLV